MYLGYQIKKKQKLTEINCISIKKRRKVLKNLYHLTNEVENFLGLFF